MVFGVFAEYLLNFLCKLNKLLDYQTFRSQKRLFIINNCILLTRRNIVIIA